MLKLEEARSKPQKDEAASFYHGYLDAVKQDNLLDALKHSAEGMNKYFKDLTDKRLDFRYDEGKWSIAEVLIHLADSERVFAYRALRISRGDQTPMPGYDQNEFVPNSGADQRSLASIQSEMRATREATIVLFENMNAEQLVRRGVASENEISCRALGFLIAGHERHHLRILESRYS